LLDSIQSANENLSGSWWHKGGQHAYSGSLARTIVAKKSVEFACLDIKIQIIYDGAITVDFGEINRPNTGFFVTRNYGFDCTRAPDYLIYARCVHYFRHELFFTTGDLVVLAERSSSV
jgi:hypothetical protein